MISDDRARSLLTLFVHIVPHLPPEICGVGDYAMAVGGKIEELHPEVRCGYLACGYRRSNATENAAARRDITGHCNVGEIWQCVTNLAEGRAPEEVAIVLHYSGYGFATDGAPTWLADALERRPREWSKCRVVTFFHELFATGRPWDRAFWLSGRQKTVAKRVARASDALLTNRSQNARWLKDAIGCARSSIPHLAIPSNVGEPPQTSVVDQRQPIAVVFGKTRFKEWFLDRNAIQTVQLCKHFKIDRIIDIGPSVDRRNRFFLAHGISLERLGILPAELVSRWLCSARLGFQTYFPGSLAKSGSLAALASHGVPTVIADNVPIATDALEPFVNFLPFEDVLRNTRQLRISVQELANIGAKLLRWYQEHDITAHARLMVKTVGQRE
jgi:hypothetical protein